MVKAIDGLSAKPSLERRIQRPTVETPEDTTNDLLIISTSLREAVSSSTYPATRVLLYIRSLQSHVLSYDIMVAVRLAFGSLFSGSACGSCVYIFSRPSFSGVHSSAFSPLLFPTCLSLHPINLSFRQL